MPSSDRVEPTRDTTAVVGPRIGAQIVDLVLMFVQMFVVTMALALLVRPERAEAVQGFAFVGLLTLPLYGGLLEGFWNGRTVGKRLFGIRVVDRRGDDPSLEQAFLRNVPALILFSWASSAVALAAMAMSDRRQRVFDRAAGTYVVRASGAGAGTRTRSTTGSTGATAPSRSRR